MIATRLRSGAISESNSSHLPASVASELAKPVMFPPGWLSRGTMPLETGSDTPAKTIGIVRVSRWTAMVAGVPYVTIISGWRPTNSCASHEHADPPYAVALLRAPRKRPLDWHHVG